MNRASILARVLVTGIAVVALVGTARAQAVHVDKKLGFQFKPPKDYRSVAIDPLERTVVAKYQADGKDSSGDAGGASFSRVFQLEYYPAGRSASDDEVETGMDAWQTMLDDRYTNLAVTVSRDSSISGAKAREVRYSSADEPLSVYCMILEAEDGVFVFEGTALTQRFKEAATDFAKSVKSFKRIERADRTDRDAELAQMSEQERFLQLQIEKLPPGWDSLRTPRYLFLFNADKGFVKELAERIEAIRDEYERLYPPDRPIEAVSIVRVCNTRDEYQAYGGPPNTGGYWYDVARELVFFDHRPRDLPLLVLNHEAFHQYIYYFYGQLSPHSWYNEGHGDYFAGAKMTKTNRIAGYGEAPGGYSRLPTIKEGCRLYKEGKPVKEGAAVSLKKILAYHQSDYYENPGVCYAQGWAIVYMLREAKGQDEKWKRILPDYLQNLLAARHQIATELMEKELKKWEALKADYAEGGEGASSELPKEPSRDPKDYYAQASNAKENDVQDLAFKKTFGDWTDEDWSRFQEFFLNYVEKL
jgi:hypothetical protein